MGLSIIYNTSNDNNNNNNIDSESKSLIKLNHKCDMCDSECGATTDTDEDYGDCRCGSSEATYCGSFCACMGVFHHKCSTCLFGRHHGYRTQVIKNSLIN